MLNDDGDTQIVSCRTRYPSRQERMSTIPNPQPDWRLREWTKQIQGSLPRPDFSSMHFIFFEIVNFGYMKIVDTVSVFFSVFGQTLQSQTKNKRFLNRLHLLRNNPTLSLPPRLLPINLILRGRLTSTLLTLPPSPTTKIPAPYFSISYTDLNTSASQ